MVFAISAAEPYYRAEWPVEIAGETQSDTSELFMDKRTRLSAFCALLLAVSTLFHLELLCQSVTEPETAAKFELAIPTSNGTFVQTLIFSHDASLAASLGSDGASKIWDLAIGQQLWNIPSQAEQLPETTLAFTADNQYLVIGLQDGNLLIFNVETGAARRLSTGLLRGVTSIQASPNGRWLACGNGAGRIVLIDIPNAWRVALLYPADRPEVGPRAVIQDKGVSALSFSADSERLAVGFESGIFLIFEPASRTQLSAGVVKNSHIRALAFNHSGHVVAAASSKPEGYLLVSDLTDNKDWIPRPSIKVMELALSSDGQRIAVSGLVAQKLSLKMWQLESIDELALPKDVTKNVTFLLPVALSRDGSTIITAAGSEGNEISVFDLSKNSVVPLRMAAVKSVENLQIVPAKSVIVIGGGDSVGIWSLVTGAKIASWNAKGGTASFSHNGRWYGSFWPDGFLRITDLSGTRGAIRTVAKSDEVSDLALIGKGPTAVWLDGQPVIGGKINYWKLGDLDSHTLCSSEAGGVLFRAITVSPDERYFAASCLSKSEHIGVLGEKTPYTEIRVWDASNMTEKATISVPDPSSKIMDFAFTDDGKYIAFVIDGIDFEEKENFSRIVIQSVEDKGDTQHIEVKLRENEILRQIAFADSNSHVLVSTQVAGLSVGNVQEWDRQTGKLLKVIPFEGGPTKLASGGGLVAIGMANGTTKFLDAKTLSEMVTLIDTGPRDWLAVNPEYLFDGTADSAQLVGWRRTGTRNILPLDIFFNDYYYPGLITETMWGRHPTPPQGNVGAALGLPGWDLMYQRGLTHLEPRNGKVLLCLLQRPTVHTGISTDGEPLRFAPSELIHRPEDTSCPWQKELPDSVRQYELAAPNSPAAQACSVPTGQTNNKDNSSATLHVLTVALSEYQHNEPPLGYGRLPSSVASARNVEQFFDEQKVDPHRSFREIQVWPHLWNNQATRQAIRDTFAEMAGKIQPNDVVFLFLSAHGIIPTGQEMFYLAPYDWRGDSLREIRNTGLSTAMLADAVRNLPARRIVLIIDACQSGGALDSLQKIAKIKARIEQLRQTNIEQFRPTPDSVQVGVHILASATPLQVATAPSTPEPDLLVRLLIEALRRADEPKNKTDSIDGIFQYVCEGLLHANRQTPLVVSEGANFSIAGISP
jgi:WD40 repeat protein